MNQLIVGKNDLATVNPTLAKEWHPQKNGDLKPNMISAGSSKKVWWLLPYDDTCTGKHFDFEWEAAVSSRVSGVGCPYISNQKVWVGYNDLATTYPELAQEWHPTLNKELTPQMVLGGSAQKIWWLCPNNHSYESSLNSRTNRHSGCPFCSGRKAVQGVSDLATTHPELIEEWDYDKNNNYTPQSVSEGSDIKIWWRCPIGHSYSSTIANRVGGKGCPYCCIPAKKVLTGFNDLATTDPELLSEWDYDKNTNLLPTLVTRGMLKKAWWRCPASHSYSCSINAKTSHGIGCPYCSGKQIMPGFNDLATTDPDLLKEWDYNKNIIYTPQTVSRGMDKKVWWLCSKTHSYQALVSDKAQGNGCPYCSGKQILVGFNDLATTHPDLASEWDYSKNKLTPQMVTPGSNKSVMWLCTLGHSYRSQINNRTKPNGTACPYCSIPAKKILVGFNDLSTTHPTLCQEWDYTKNGQITPQQISKGSNKKVWWLCEEKHSFRMTVGLRTSQFASCPICKGSKTERLLYAILNKLSIPFVAEKCFEKYIKVKFYPYDVYCYENNVIIEADGEQHFTDCKDFFFSTIPFPKRVKHDNIKNSFCLEQKIPILRIPYIYNPNTDCDKIEHFIDYFIKTRKVPKEIIDFYSQFDFSNYADVTKKLNSMNTMQNP